MTRRDDESIASTIRRETNLTEIKRQLYVALKQVSEFRKLTGSESELFHNVSVDHRIQELFNRSK